MEGDRYKLTRDLTLHALAKEVIMDLWYGEMIGNPSFKDITSALQLTGASERSDVPLDPKTTALTVSGR